MAEDGTYERARAQIEAARVASGLDDLRCEHCGALFMRYRPPLTYIEVKCYRCNYWMVRSG